jgi:RNA polymerase sigma-70 factor (ECF subfamily)
MPDTPVPGVLRRLRRALGHADSSATDAQLLERFLARRDEDAFELLVWRHERLVLSACRRILHDAQDAEDAFQATFLTLVRKGSAISRGQALASWLYQVACRIALRARAGVASRAGRERQGLDLSGIAADADGAAEAERRELGPLLDEEISRLPEKYRAAVVLCYLEGRTYDETARRLGCPVGTLSTRLAHARERLRARLARRGVGLGAGALATILCERAASAAVPGALVSATVRAAASVAAGRAAAGVVAPQVAAMTEGALRAMLMTKLRIAAAFLLVVGLLGGGAILMAPGAPAARAAGETKKEAASEGGEAGKAQTDRERLQGTWLVVGAEEQGEKVSEKGLQEAKETFVVKGETMTYCRDGKVQVTMKIRLDPGKIPATVDLEFTGGKEKGYKNYAIYRLDGDTLKLRMNDKFGGNSVNERPANFSTAEGKEAVLFILKRARGSPEPAKGPAPSARAEAPKTDKERFQGTWVAVSLNANNQEVPTDVVRAIQITFRGDRMTWKRPSESDETAGYAIDPTQMPKTIDLLIQRAYRGIYEFTGDRLRLCIIDNQHPRPADFQPGEKRLVFVLKRVNGGAKPAEKPAPSPRGEPKNDKERLQGAWVGVSINAKGEDVPAEQARAYRITFAGDRMKPQRPLEAREEDIPYRIDPTQKPKTIDFLARRAALGIYEFDGDKLRLCLTDEDAPRPTDFKPGERRVVIVLKRAGVPARAGEEADLKLLVKALREALAKLRESNAFLKEELLKRTEESERRKDEIGGVLTKVDVGNNTVSLTLGRTKLALNRVPLSVRSKFFLGLKECTINDLKPGMEVTLRLETNGERSEVVRLEAGPAGKE